MAVLIYRTTGKSFEKNKIVLKNLKIFICILLIVFNFINDIRKKLLKVYTLCCTRMRKNVRNENQSRPPYVLFFYFRNVPYNSFTTFFNLKISCPRQFRTLTVIYNIYIGAPVTFS